MPLPAGTRLGPYEILSPLGAGGMGDVYKARDTRLRRDVALKVLPEAFARDRDRLARFTREAHVLASLNHPHIAQIYGLEEAPATEPGRPDVHALAMELVHGDTLEQLLERQAHRSLDVDRAVAVARQIAEALAAAHDKGIIHRDLKPGNLIVSADGTVKVLDFGLAKTADRAPGIDSDAQTLANSPTAMPGDATEFGIVLGTAAYMSPEQARGQAVDKRADVWAFGCVLYEMLAGRRVFSGATVTDTLAAIMRDQPDWSLLPVATPPIVRWLVARCLEKDVKQRLQDLSDARLMLDDGGLLIDGGGSKAATRAATTARSRGLAGWVTAGLLGLGLLASLTVVVRHWREVPQAPERPVQFPILPPEGLQFTRPVHLAVSRDSRYVVFTVESGGAATLWLRPVESLTARPLTGTDGATYPFWSPDSQSIGYFSSGKLQTIRIDGGPPTFVCAAATGRGGTWNQEGVIVFSAGTDAPLQRVSAKGGTVTPVTTLDPPRENSHRMPSFLPDGRHFLFLAGGQAAAGGIAWQVKVGSLDDPNTARVVDAELGSSPTFSQGHLLLSRNRSLQALRFDPSTRQPSGAPFTVTAQPFASTSAASASFGASPDGLLAFVAVADLHARLAWVDRNGKVIRTIGDSMAFFGLSLSSDERRAAVAIETGPLRGRDIWIVDLADGTQSKLTVDPASENFPLWSEDGSVVYFSSTRNGSANMFRKSSDRKGPEELLMPSDRSQYPSDVSRDGQFIVFTQVTATGTDIWALPLRGERKPSAFVQGASAKKNGTLSPDGRWLAYQSNESAGRDEVYVQPFPGPGPRTQVSTNGGAEPVWRPDGKELFFISSGSVVAAQVDTTGPVAGRLVSLFPLSASSNMSGSQQYAASRDGKRFLTAIAEGQPVRNPVTVITNWLSAVR